MTLSSAAAPPVTTGGVLTGGVLGFVTLGGSTGPVPAGGGG